MDKIEQYAIAVVADGAEHCGEDDIEEAVFFDGDDESWKAACDLAVKLAHWIRDNPETVLAAFKGGPAVNIPKKVTRRQIRDALAVLGLDAEDVTALSMDARDGTISVDLAGRAIIPIVPAPVEGGEVPA